MRKLGRYFFWVILIAATDGQSSAQTIPDGVIRQYESANSDSQKIIRLYLYLDNLPKDSTFLPKATKLTDFLQSKNDTRDKDLVQLGINDELSKTGDYATSLASTLEITNRFEQQKDRWATMRAYSYLSTNYYYAGEKEKDIVYAKKAIHLALELNDASQLALIANNLSTTYSQKAIPDSALQYARFGISYARLSGNKYALIQLLGTIAEAFISTKQYDSALIYLRACFLQNGKLTDLENAWTMNDFSQIFIETNQYDSSKYYARKTIGIPATMQYKDQLQRAYEYLSLSFNATRQPDSAYKYLQLAVKIKDSLYSNDKTTQVQGVMAREQSRLQQLEKEKIDYQNKIRIYGLIMGLAILSIIAFILYRNNIQKQKANANLQLQKEKVEATLQELKVTQQQLIQSEKMASLGELTAGIAHEIQNPLNFVNNFSEVNQELAEELKGELAVGNQQLAIELANDIKDNSEKINHHGKRADAIVKGMLQHSRSSTNVKELTDINALADEYLRLAYHGLRAKEKTFNATLKTDFYESIEKINIIPQDIGRVLLNLYTNAFYAVNERKKEEGVGFEPTVSVSTKNSGNQVFITVSDNGNGIPQKIVDKIFQPFFTTKPTGQGTGLGLSLAYDIVKAHGGEIKVETEGEGSTFIIHLPIV